MGDIIDRLSEYTSCDIADALIKLNVPHGGFLSDLVMHSPTYLDGQTKIVGQAYTVKFVRNNHVESPKPPNHYIDTVPQGSVLFISAPPNLVNAVYGGLMSTRAQYLGAVGTIVDGRIRDLNEHRSLKYPVFCRAIGTTPAAEVARPSEINVPVRLNSTLQEAWIHPGDYIIGDIDGVVCVPRNLVDKVLEVVPAIVEADQKIARDLRNGRVLAESFAEHRAKR